MHCKSLDTSKEGWRADLGEHTARGTWSLPEINLHINYLELKVVFLASKEFQELYPDKIMLEATDNTTVIVYIYKEGGMEVGSTVCPAVENPDLMFQETGDSQGLKSFQAG